MPLTRKLDSRYDLIIVGGGPAGLTAALYAARLNVKSVVITNRVGGLLNEAAVIDDYPGIPEAQASVLIDSFKKHVDKYGVPIVLDTVVSFKAVEGGEYEVRTVSGLTTKTYTIILAIGTRRRMLGIPGEVEFRGRGVSYCSVCDAPLFKGASAVAVVGGGNSALEGALIVSNYAEKVYLIHRRDEFRAFPYYVSKVLNSPKIVRLMSHVVTEIRGDSKVRSVLIRNLKTGEVSELPVDGIFIEIGFEPYKDFLTRNSIEVDEEGFIKVNDRMETNLPGVFAAGDCTTMWKGFRQVITSAAMGAIAAYSAYNYLLKIKT